MAIKRISATLKGMTGDIYTRIINTSAIIFKSKKAQLVLGHYGSEEYREENGSDYTKEVVEIEYTEEELETISKINYEALKRLEIFKSGEDC